MIARRHILSSLPLLAAALTGRNGITVTFEGTEAHTTGKNIVIPELPLDSDPTVIASVRGHIDLQSAHIRYTDSRAVARANMGSVQAWCWRIIEDWRVGQKMAAAYPGSRSNMNWLISRECGRQCKDWPGDYPDSGPNLGISALLHIRATVLSWDVPEVIACNAPHTAALRRIFPGLVNALDRLLARVRAHCPDTQSAIDHAARLAECLQNCGLDNSAQQETGMDAALENHAHGECAPADTCPQDDMSGELGEEGYENGGEASGAVIASEGNGSPTEENSLHSEMPGQQIEDSNGATNGAGGSFFEEQLRQAMEQPPQSLGEALVDTLNDAISKRRRVDTFQSPMEGTRSAKPMDSLRRKIALQATVALKIRLQGLLQADTMRRSALGRRGKLHTRSLYRLAVGNPKLFLRDSDKRDTDTAVHILLDASGSMCGKRIELAADACYAVARALESIRGVSVGISVFPATRGEAVGIFPLVRHDERVSDAFDIQGEGDTPLTEALWWALQQLAPRKEPRKLLLVLSDGQPNDRGTATKAFAVLKAAGIECFGIGIMDSSIGLLLPYSHCVINSLNALTPTMFAMLQNAMRQG